MSIDEITRQLVQRILQLPGQTVQAPVSRFGVVMKMRRNVFLMVTVIVLAGWSPTVLVEVSGTVEAAKSHSPEMPRILHVTGVKKLAETCN